MVSVFFITSCRPIVADIVHIIFDKSKNPYFTIGGMLLYESVVILSAWVSTSEISMKENLNDRYICLAFILPIATCRLPTTIHCKGECVKHLAQCDNSEHDFNLGPPFLLIAALIELSFIGVTKFKIACY